MKSPEDTDPSTLLAQRVRVLQIIVGALVAGLLTLIAVASMIAFSPRAQKGGPPAIASQPILSYMAYFMAFAMIPASIIVSQSMVSSGRKRLAAKPSTNDSTDLLNLYQVKLIVSGALSESVGNLAAIAFLIERQAGTLGLALACVIAVAILFPRQEQVEEWLDDQRQRLEQEREFSELPNE